MKKFLFSVILLLCCFYIFAGTPELVGIGKNSNCRIQQNGGVTTESYVSSSGTTYELSGSMADSSRMNYQLIIKNPVGNNYINQSDFVTVYQGDITRDYWTRINYTIDPINIPNPSQTVQNDESGLTTAEFCVIAGTVCLCSIALWDMCDTLVDGDSSGPIAPAPRHSGPTIWIDPYIDVGSSSNSSRSNSISQSNNVLYNQTSVNSSDYILAFHFNSSNKYDYKISVNSGNQIYDYYFMRTDKKNSINQIATTNSKYNSFLVSVGIPNVTRLGGMYIYSGDPIGFYFGGNYQNDAKEFDALGYIDEHNYSNLKPGIMMPTTGDTYFKFNDMNETVQNLYAFNIGLDIKISDCIWLLGGCSIDFNKTYRYGKILSSSDGTNYTELTEGFVQDNYIDYVPQIGLNLIFDHVDIGGIVGYSMENGVTGSVMLGVAF